MKAKGGRERLHNVHSLAVYLKPAPVNFAGSPTNWLCVFPDRYFEFEGASPGMTQRAIVVDGRADRAAMDATGVPRGAHRLSRYEHDRLILNQLLFLLESAWMRPELLEIRKNVLTVEAAGSGYQLYLDHDSLPERIVSRKGAGHEETHYDYRLKQYRSYDGLMLPARIESVGRTRESIWDADYEVDAKYNPKLFERIPELSNGPEPWRMR